jgi:hemerythrin-like domain-containing protein
MTSATPKPSGSPRLSGRQFADPIAFIRQDHDRQCEICDQLEDMANFLDQPPELKQIESIRSFLTEDLNRHIEDEEIDLFPALARRCKSDPVLDGILYQLASEHELDRGLVDPILKEINMIVENGAARHPMRLVARVHAFVETQRRHLTWENRVVLPLAERQLTDEDKQAMGRSMASRRGLTYPD